MKVVHSEQLSVGLSDLKSQLDAKEYEAENLQQTLNKLQDEKVQSEKAMQNMNNLSAENESLKQQVLSLTDSMSVYNQTVAEEKKIFDVKKLTKINHIKSTLATKTVRFCY